MKTILKIQCIALFGISLLFSACEKETFDLTESSDQTPEIYLSDEKAEAYLQKSNDFFDFELQFSECSRNGVSLLVYMPSLKGYFFYWTLDGNFMTTESSLKCASGDIATITVTRRADGMTRTKTVLLFNGPDGEAEAPAFDVQMVISPCFASGATIQARTPTSPQDYAFLWEVDNKPAGHFHRLTCICGKNVKVRVTRFSDGATVTKSVEMLSYCEPDD